MKDITLIIKLSIILVRGTVEYVKEDLFGDIFDGRNTEESRNYLLQYCPYHAEKIEELVKMKTTIAQALEIFSNL